MFSKETFKELLVMLLEGRREHLPRGFQLSIYLAKLSQCAIMYLVRFFFSIIIMCCANSWLWHQLSVMLGGGALGLASVFF